MLSEQVVLAGTRKEGEREKTVLSISCGTNKGQHRIVYGDVKLVLMLQCISYMPIS